MNYYGFLFLALCGWASAGDGASCITARTESGLVCGILKKAVDGTDFVSFLGIPYAKPPLGELRFAEPQRPDDFIGIFNATVPGPICPQHPTKLVAAFQRPVSMSEDCLHLNVHVPKALVPDLNATEESNLLPVLAFVHGGSFADGSGDPDTYGPEYLMTKGIIVVTFNYRVSLPGFLSLKSKYVPGNAALRDVLFALKWVQRNIVNFGGDPKQVTLGGVSAGSSIAHLVAISPAVKGQGLFRNVLLMSGTAIAGFFSPSPAKVTFLYRLLLEALGIDPLLPPRQIHEELTRIPIEDLLGASQYLRNRTGTGVGFEPVIEIPRKGFTTMIPKDPELLLDEGYGNEYPTLLGFTNGECEIYKHRLNSAQPLLRKLPTLTIPQNLLLKSSILSKPVLTRMISKQYFNGSLSTTNHFLSLCTDSYYKYPVFRTVEKRLRMKAEPSFIYEFGYDRRNESILKSVQDADWIGVGHIEDLGFTFRTNAILPPVSSNELIQQTDASKITQFMTTSVSNFVKYGHPGEHLADWPESGFDFELMSVVAPEPQFVPLSPQLAEMKTFFDKLYKIGRE